MRKATIVCVVAVVFFCGIAPVNGQEGNETGTESRPIPAAESKPKLIKPVQPYRLDLSLDELQDGKKANTRHYSLNLTAGSGNEIKIGTRVPVRTGPRNPDNPLVSTQFQYMDVGTNIWAFLREVGDELQLEVRGEVSDLDKGPNTDLAPIVRQMKISGSTLLVTGKPILVGSVDDPNSNRQFQLQVTVTKLR